VAGASSRPKALAFSAEAREAAFLSLRAEAASPRARRSAAEAGAAVPAAPTKRPSSSSAGSGAVPDRTATATPARVAVDDSAARPRPAPRAMPTVLGGVSRMALAAAVLVGVLVGGAAGALTAPAAVVRSDARGRAERQLAEGNRFYETGRFDDALGKYKGAINIDRTFAIAHRAKGAALAKQQRWDDAAAAYKDYLDLERDAIDAGDVRESIARRALAGEAPAGGGGG
jgi:tetratricopeptide (TPR) repeat protein